MICSICIEEVSEATKLPNGAFICSQCEKKLAVSLEKLIALMEEQDAKIRTGK